MNALYEETYISGTLLTTNAFLQKFGQLTNTSCEMNWCLSAAETIDQGDCTNFRLFSDDNEQAFALFSKYKHESFINTLTGYNGLFEAIDFAYSTKQQLDCLLSNIKKESIPFKIDRLPADSHTVSGIKSVFIPSFIVKTQLAACYPYLDIKKSLMTACNLVSASLKRDLRRARNKAIQFGPYEFEIIRPNNQAALLEAIDIFCNIEDNSWKHRAGSSLKANIKQRRFMESFLGKGLNSYPPIIFASKINQQFVAAQLTYINKNRLYVLKIGYDERFSKYSPGQILMEDILNFAIDNNLDSIELQGQSEQWTQRWTTDERQTVRMIVVPRSIKGIWAIAMTIKNELSQKVRNHIKRRMK